MEGVDLLVQRLHRGGGGGGVGDTGAADSGAGAGSTAGPTASAASAANAGRPAVSASASAGAVAQQPQIQQQQLEVAAAQAAQGQAHQKAAEVYTRVLAEAQNQQLPFAQAQGFAKTEADKVFHAHYPSIYTAELKRRTQQQQQAAAHAVATAAAAAAATGTPRAQSFQQQQQLYGRGPLTFNPFAPHLQQQQQPGMQQYPSQQPQQQQLFLQQQFRQQQQQTQQQFVQQQQSAPGQGPAEGQGTSGRKRRPKGIKPPGVGVDGPCTSNADQPSDAKRAAAGSRAHNISPSRAAGVATVPVAGGAAAAAAAAPGNAFTASNAGAGAAAPPSLFPAGQEAPTASHKAKAKHRKPSAGNSTGLGARTTGVVDNTAQALMGVLRRPSVQAALSAPMPASALAVPTIARALPGPGADHTTAAAVEAEDEKAAKEEEAKGQASQQPSAAGGGGGSGGGGGCAYLHFNLQALRSRQAVWRKLRHHRRDPEDEHAFISEFMPDTDEELFRPNPGRAQTLAEIRATDKATGLPRYPDLGRVVQRLCTDGLPEGVDVRDATELVRCVHNQLEAAASRDSGRLAPPRQPAALAPSGCQFAPINWALISRDVQEFCSRRLAAAAVGKAPVSGAGVATAGLGARGAGAGTAAFWTPGRCMNLFQQLQQSHADIEHFYNLAASRRQEARLALVLANSQLQASPSAPTAGAFGGSSGSASVRHIYMAAMAQAAQAHAR